MLGLSPLAASLWALLIVVRTHVAVAAGGHSVDLWNLEKEWGLEEEEEDPYEAFEDRKTTNQWEKNLEKAGKRQKKARKQAIKEGKEPEEELIDFSDPNTKDQIRQMMMGQGGGFGGFGGNSFGSGAGAFSGLQQAVGAAPNKLDEGKSSATLKKGFCNYKGCVREKLQNWGSLMTTGGVKSQYIISSATHILYVKSNDMKKLGEFLLQQPEVEKWTYKNKEYFPESRDEL